MYFYVYFVDFLMDTSMYTQYGYILHIYNILHNITFSLFLVIFLVIILSEASGINLKKENLWQKEKKFHMKK